MLDISYLFRGLTKQYCTICDLNDIENIIHDNRSNIDKKQSLRSTISHISTKKPKGTLPSSIFKIEGNKVPLHFLFLHIGAEIWLLCHFIAATSTSTNIHERQCGHILELRQKIRN